MSFNQKWKEEIKYALHYRYRRLLEAGKRQEKVHEILNDIVVG